MYNAKPFIDPDTVTDRDSVVRFVEYLAADRVAAADVENADPQCYQWDWGWGRGLAEHRNSRLPRRRVGRLFGAA